MNKIVFVSDFFVEQIIGGGELNDYECFKALKNKNFNVEKINSHLLKKQNLSQDCLYIVSNFVNLRHEVIEEFQNYTYIIYEHDHKYLKSRNPANFINFVAPPSELVNISFYKSAKAVLCQTDFHLKIVKKNTGLENLINLGGNLWSSESLQHMLQISKNEKVKKIAILNSDIEHKNTKASIEWCLRKNKEYNLVSDSNYLTFLSKLGKNEKFLFMPKTPETLSRVCVEARMMNMGVITNGLIGASKEDWFSLKGEELINFMFLKRQKIIDIILGFFNE